ncbi:response regulator [Flavobacterium sp. C4GT6]|uniref:response regulator n=1 Tax=Flavobacterium sp. C4GT6 TaxID=3103818 RepID=UPI002ED3065B
MVLNLLLFTIAFVTFLQDVGDFNLGIDQFVTTDHKGVAAGKPTPGRMSMATSLCFTLLSISLGLVRFNNDKAKKGASYLSLIVIVISFFAIVTFIYNIPTFDKVSFISSMAIHTAIGFFIAGLAITLTIPNHGITELFTSRRIGSYMIRRMFFQLTTACLLLSYVILYYYRQGYFAADFSITMVAVIVIFATLILLVIVSRSMNSIDREKRAAEEELNVINMYLNATPDPLIVVNKQGTIELTNNLMSEVFGYTEEELKSKTMDSLIPVRYHAEYKKHFKYYFDYINDVEKKGKEYHGSSVIEIYANKRGGEEFPVEMTLNSTWSPKGLITVAAFRDVTRRVNAENKLQAALEASIIGIWDYDILQGKLHWDETMYKLYGADPEKKESLYDLWTTRVHPEDRNKIETLLNDSIAGHSVYDTDFRIILTGGTIRHMRAKGTVYRDENKKPVRMLGTNWDITGQKTLEASLIEAKKAAESASKSKSEFLANMSHEIRTPLNGIIGFTDLLIKTPLNESQAEYLKNVNNSANLLLDVINDILDFSKIEAGKLELHYEEVDVYELCEQTIDVIRHQAEQKKLEVLLNIPPDIQRYVYADPVRLRQILTNLLSNAIKFTHTGEIELHLESRIADEDENKTYFQFSVRDTGVGIASDKLSKIFGAFDQEDSSTTRKYGGTGLGLTISNKLLALMGSKLNVESELNKGTEFSFEVQFEIPDGKLTEKTALFRNVKKVLVVDDNESNRRILEVMLAEMNIESLLANNGIEAMELLEEHKDFDFAIVDYNMPYMSGTDLISQIRNTLNLSADNLPIMLLHSTADDDIIFKAIKDYNINFNYTKPIHSGKLKTVLDRLANYSTATVAIANGKSISLQVDDVVSFSGENTTILVAEDNPVNQLLAREILMKIVPDANLIIAENGKEAVEMYQTENPDIVFMDIQMPEMSGLDATKKIRDIENQQDKHIPIIALTARVLNGERETCIEYGMDDYLSKPIILDRVKAIVKTYLIK